MSLYTARTNTIEWNRFIVMKYGAIDCKKTPTTTSLRVPFIANNCVPKPLSLPELLDMFQKP